MPISAQSRLKVLNNPELAPGICFLNGCVGDGERKFIDFGKNIEWYGAVYICTQCIVEVVEAADFVPVATFDKLHDAYRSLEIEHRQLQNRYAPFEEAINNVVESRNSNPHLAFDSLRASVSESKSSEDESHDNGKSVEGESETDKPVDVEGSDDLFDSSDFDD